MCIKPIFRKGFILLAFTYSCVLISCKNHHRNKAHPEVPVASIEAGEGLAKKYCQSCHALPDPSMLSSKTWETGVLPQMGPRLGIFYYGFERYPSQKNDKSLPADFYPRKQMVSFNEWQNIIDYYTATSPDTLIPTSDNKISNEGLPLFTAVTPSFRYESPSASYVHFNERDTSHSILFCDAIKQNLYVFNQKLQVKDSIYISRGTIVDIDFGASEKVACNIGFMNPNNGRSGEARLLTYQNEKWTLQEDPLFNNLQRPVQITSADVNVDGRADYVVCEFGYLTGALSWMEHLGNGKYKRHVLRSLPGAIKCYVNDYNADGLPDLWVLFSQGEEGIFLYTNKGQGKFEEKQVLRFPAVQGSSYFELVDFNKDNRPDIVYTCGDNADYSSILKPYHGVYIFLNDGKNNFRQSFFYHINGCFKAIARDFDGDNDIDIATISFFADYKNRPEEGFIYLNNTGNNHFNSYTLPETKSGRWLTMDAGDMNSDGMTDLVLGNFSNAPSAIKPSFDWKKGPPFLVLQNTGKKFSE